MIAKRKSKRKFQKGTPSFLRSEFYATPTLLQRVEDAIAKAGMGSRSELICSLLESWASSRGC